MSAPLDAVIGNDQYTCPACGRDVHIEVVAGRLHVVDGTYVVDLGMTADSHAAVDFHADSRCVA